MDLNVSYSVTYAGDSEPTVITPSVKTRQLRVGDQKGSTFTVIRGLAALFADKLDAITDEGDRRHACERLRGALITIRPHTVEDSEHGVHGNSAWRDFGRLETTYVYGTGPVTRDDVLDVAEKLRDQLS